MKKALLLLLICISFPTFARNSSVADTTIQVNDRIIKINETESKLKVRVFDINSDSTEEQELIFEGHYRDGQSYETRHKSRSVSINFPTWNRSFEPHWDGFSMGFANISDKDFSINTVDGVSIRSGNSLEYNLNLFEKAFSFSKNRWAFVTGAGMRWSRYRFDGMYLKQIDKSTVVVYPESGTLNKSKLNITSIVFPVLLEWQKQYKKRKCFFINGGAEAVIRTAASSKIEYTDADGIRHKEKVGNSMTLLPLSMDFILQAGYHHIGVYARYSPFSLFENSKGPDIHPVALGMQFHF